MVSGRIITVRHGRPDLSREVVISARQYTDWWAAYNESGLHSDERPPAALKALAEKTPTILSSTLRRAIETAAHLTGPEITAGQDPVFVEAPLPAPPVPLLRLRPGPWGVLARTFWVCGWAPGDTESSSETWKRVDRAIDRLTKEAESGDTMVCAHGYFNWMVHRRMLKRGWRLVEHVGGNKYWSCRVYEAG
ncbi:MAG: phosphoglycerate mutase family protein [Pseudomonadota bacterium]